MTRLALIRIADKSIVAVPLAEGGWVTLPGIGQVSPATAGWQGGGDPPQFDLVEVVDFVVPDGKHITGPASYAYDPAPGSVSEIYPVEDTPAPPVLTPAEKLANAGLTVDDLKTLLGLS